MYINIYYYFGHLISINLEQIDKKYKKKKKRFYATLTIQRVI